jgi:hypothetical protein
VGSDRCLGGVGPEPTPSGQLRSAGGSAPLGGTAFTAPGAVLSGVRDRSDGPSVWAGGVTGGGFPRSPDLPSLSPLSFLSSLCDLSSPSACEGALPVVLGASGTDVVVGSPVGSGASASGGSTSGDVVTAGGSGAGPAGRPSHGTGSAPPAAASTTPVDAATAPITRAFTVRILAKTDLLLGALAAARKAASASPSPLSSSWCAGAAAARSTAASLPSACGSPPRMLMTSSLASRHPLVSHPPRTPSARPASSDHATRLSAPRRGVCP